MEDVHDLRADEAEPELAMLLADLLPQHEHDAQHGAGKADDAREIQQHVMAVVALGDLKQLVSELLHARFIEDVMLAEADDHHFALFAYTEDNGTAVGGLRPPGFLGQRKRPSGQ